MSFQILKIDRDILTQMKPLLSASAGYSTSMSDELEYFDMDSQRNWFVAVDEAEKTIGFVRSFNQGEWSQGELFVSLGVNRRLIATELLKKFIQYNSFEAGHRLRFDVNCSDSAYISSIEELGLNQKAQTFYYYDLDLSKQVWQSEDMASNLAVVEVAEALCNLHPVTLDEVETWIKNKSIRTVSYQGRVVAAAHILNYGDLAEINRIATNSKFLRRGFCKILLQNICHELSQGGVKMLFLKVEDLREPAIKFYENFGFVRNEMKTQIWFSKYF